MRLRTFFFKIQNKRFVFSFLFINFIFNVLCQVPDSPVIDSVSVIESSQKIIVSWSVASNENIDGYRVRREVWGQSGYQDGAIITISNIANNQQTAFIDTVKIPFQANASSSWYAYYVTSYRMNVEGEEVTSYGFGQRHSSIYLKTVAFDACRNEISLRWTRYWGWESNFSHYSVYYREANANLWQIAGNTADTFFVHRNLIANTSYSYFIRAFHKDKKTSSSSNLKVQQTPTQAAPDTLYAAYADVKSSRQIELSFLFDQEPEVKHFALIRKTTQTDTLQHFFNLKSNLVFTDENANTAIQNKYSLLALNQCSVVIGSSNTASNIVLKVENETQNWGEVNLKWKAYETWSSGIKEYNVFRIISGQEAELISTITQTSAAEYVFNENISNILSDTYTSQVTFSYFVEAVENHESIYNCRARSKSNIVCVEERAKVLFANAFSPNSEIEKNRVFKPIMYFVSDYYFAIYSRFGTKIFESRNQNEAWDGTIGGKPAPEGVYIYYISYGDKTGKRAEKIGQVSLMYH